MIIASGDEAIRELIVEPDVIVSVGTGLLFAVIETVDIGDMTVYKVMHVKSVRELGACVVIIVGCPESVRRPQMHWGSTAVCTRCGFQIQTDSLDLCKGGVRRGQHKLKSPTDKGRLKSLPVCEGIS